MYKVENTDLLAKLESYEVELSMLRAAVDSFKIIEEDAGYRAATLEVDLKKTREDFENLKLSYEDSIRDLKFKLNQMETNFAGLMKERLKPLLMELGIKDQI